MPRPLTPTMLNVLALLHESGKPMLLGNPGEYGAARALVRRGYVEESLQRMDNGANAKAFQITIKGWKVHNSLTQKEGCHHG